MSTPRRLAADVVGYSRLVSAAEAEALGHISEVVRLSARVRCWGQNGHCCPLRTGSR
jgi:hypothetical protein